MTILKVGDTVQSPEGEGTVTKADCGHQMGEKLVEIDFDGDVQVLSVESVLLKNEI